MGTSGALTLYQTLLQKGFSRVKMFPSNNLRFSASARVSRGKFDHFQCKSVL